MTTSWWRDDEVLWSSGPWTLALRGDELAEIRHDGRMLLRGVRAAVRDHGWLTVPATVDAVESGEDALILTLRHEGLGASISSRLSARATPRRLTIDWRADNHTDLDTCRVGLVALHPAADAGRTVAVVHTDDRVETTSFPTAISPHQPITDIRELRIDAGPTIRFEGDVFEMEDQRNWSDASFKTYSRPLDLPYPYRLPAGESIRQTITVEAPRAALPSPAAGGPANDVVIELAEGGPFPRIGVEASTAPSSVAPADLGDFRVVELDLTTPTWAAALSRAGDDGIPLDVRLITDGSPRALHTAVQALGGHRIARITAFDSVLHVSDDPTVGALRTALADAGVAAPVLAGARSHFTELNREQQRIAREVDGIVVTTTPLFHTGDTEQLVEAVVMQRLIARQSVDIASGLPVHIGPVSLRPRFNNVATSPEPSPTRADLSEGYGAQFTGADDDRQSAPQLAAWLVASAAALAAPGVATVSWFETAGSRGLVGTPAESALRALLALGGGTLLTGDSPDGLLWAIGSRTDAGDDVLVANLDRARRRFSVRADGGSAIEVQLDGGEWMRLSVSRRAR
nr:hypothetical protein [Microbacterium hydrocarbonoxydans]